MASEKQHQDLETIEVLFKRYDSDEDGSLSIEELKQLLTDAFRSKGIQRRVSDQDINAILKVGDIDFDKKIAKSELFRIFKALENSA